MNQLGVFIFILSGGTVFFAVFAALLGLNVRLERNLFRSFALELYDELTERNGRRALGRRFSRVLIEIWRPAQLLMLRTTGIGSQGMALMLSRQAFYVNAALVSLTYFSLLYLLFANDMNTRYVVQNSSLDLPLFFRITGSWAGSAGSYLFWYFLLSVFSAVAVYQTRNRLFNRLPVLFLILGALQFLFVLLGLFFDDAQPFRTFPTPMESGRGLNPLLLHWAMVIHPPILYLGYVSAAVPFAIAMSAVITGNLREDWFGILRRWSLFSWFFLGTGILLGSKWAYEELGWGGYWAWDPVENASLMPFLLATAFLHSLIVQERRGMLRFWNVALITLTYHFCLLGTWITRSGILEGPHTFSQSTIGTPMIIYILGSLVFFLRYLYFRRHKLRPDRPLEAVTSKEGSMLLNNFLMSLALLIILIGCFSPLLPLSCEFTDGAFGCHKVEWKLNTYNKLMVPVGLLTLFLMGASPLLTWRKSVDHVYARTMRIPIFCGVVGCALFAVTYQYFFTRIPGPDESSWGPGVMAEIFAILTVGISVFVVTGLVQEFAQGVRSRTARFGENVVLALVRLTLRNKRRYGGYLVHLSIVFLFIGYSGEAFKKTQKFEFHYYKMRAHLESPVVHYYSGDRSYLENYDIQATDLFIRPVFKEGGDPSNPAHFTVSQEAHYNVFHGSASRLVDTRPADVVPYAFANRPRAFSERLLKLMTGFEADGRMVTERHFHPQINPLSGGVMRQGDGSAARTPTSEPDIRSAWNEDIYIQLGSIRDPAQNRNPNLNHLYEYYYYQAEKSPDAYRQLFPAAITATLEIWINPLVKFIWLGSILFFLSGLVILLPYGERVLK